MESYYLRVRMPYLFAANSHFTVKHHKTLSLLTAATATQHFYLLCLFFFSRTLFYSVQIGVGKDYCVLHIYIYIYIRWSLNKFPDFFRMGTFIDSIHMKLKSLRSNLLRMQCTCCTVPTTSERPHGSPLVWACQWPSSRPLSSPQLSYNDGLWPLGIT